MFKSKQEPSHSSALSDPTHSELPPHVWTCLFCLNSKPKTPSIKFIPYRHTRSGSSPGVISHPKHTRGHWDVLSWRPWHLTFLPDSQRLKWHASRHLEVLIWDAVCSPSWTRGRLVWSTSSSAIITDPVLAWPYGWPPARINAVMAEA